MKSYLAVFVAAFWAARSPGAQTAPAQTGSLHQVYILPMAGGLDQYLADWMTREKIARIVTDPKGADLLMTDRLGQAFEQQLAAIRPGEVKAPVEKPAGEKKDDKADKKTESAGASSAGRMFASAAARGNLFLVDVRSGHVVWSDHEKPHAVSDANLDREAGRVAKKLRESFLR